MKKIKYISLFSGAMGLDLGLEQSGFQTAVCNENDEDCVKTIHYNRPKTRVIDQDVMEITGKMLIKESGIKSNHIPLVTGGPPCQAFSVYGRRRGVIDRNGQLIYEFIRIVSEIKPQVFLMENVRGLLSMSLIPKNKSTNAQTKSWMTQHGSLLKDVTKELNKLGYHIDLFVVNAVNYGAPQLRERLILVGNKYGLQTEFPSPQYSNRPQDGLPIFKTLGDAIGNGFKDPCPEVLDFSPRKLKYLAMIQPGGNWRSLPVEIQKESMGKAWYLTGGRSAYWRRLSFDFPSPTVVTMPNHAGTSLCHPKENRAISIGEAAAIQEFPLEWKFQGSMSQKFRQIGNAVPVRLGKVAGKVVKNLLKRIDEGERGNNKGIREIHLRPHVRTKVYWKNSKAHVGNTPYYEDDVQQKKLTFIKKSNR